MVLYLEGLERVCLVSSKIVDLWSLCMSRRLVDDLCRLMDVLKDNVSNYYQGRKLSLIYTICLYILRPSSWPDLLFAS